MHMPGFAGPLKEVVRGVVGPSEVTFCTFNINAFGRGNYGFIVY